MRKRSIFILAFLLALYIVPSILVPSSLAPARQNNPNMTREFLTSAYGDISPQSITSFSETLEDDVLFRLDNESYGEYSESFATIADWSYASSAGLAGGEYGFVTNGDIGNLSMIANDAGNEYVYYRRILDSDLSGDEYYLEVRYKISGFSFAQVYVDNDDSGVGTLIASLSSTSYATSNTYLGSQSLAQISSINVYISDNPDTTNGQCSLFIDYLRISPADETGWQHDGSTNASITPTAGDIASSDGDIVTLDTDVTSGSFEFVIDTTATAAAISCTYYPFLSVNITSLSESDGWRLWQYDGSAWVAVSDDEGFGWTTTTGTHRYNILSLDSSVYKFRFNVTATALLGIDFIKAYSIANFTVTQHASTPTSHYLYADSGTLYRVGSDANQYYITLNHDPALSVAQGTYSVWNITTANNNPTARNDFAINFYVGAWQGWTYDETRGAMPTGTTTDLQFTSYNANSFSALKFIDIHDWQLIVSVIILFTVPLDETALNWLLIFLGLFMIPASTLYLVKGGRDGMSANKFFYFCIAFMLGWGLLLGGIYG